MDTERCRIDAGELNTEALRRAAGILRGGGLVAFPTETVYGLGGNALDSLASKRIYAAKGRPSDNPLILHIADRDGLFPLVEEIPREAELLMDAFWPGPLTLIFRKSAAVPKETTGGLETAAVRMPRHPVAAALIRAAGVPIAAPSANRSGKPSPTTADHVWEDLRGRIEMILDGGPVGIGLESTVVDVSEGTPTVLRPGYITPAMIAEVTGHVEFDRASLDGPKEGGHPKAPGMKYRHYAPEAEMLLVEGEPENVRGMILRIEARERAAGRKVRIICTDETLPWYAGTDAVSAGTRERPETVAHSLFAILRGADRDGVDLLLSETFGETELGQAVMNRLLKAAGYRIVRV